MAVGSCRSNRSNMKTFALNRNLLILIVCAGAAFNPIKAQQVEIDPATMSSRSTARLIVNRSADFGLKSANVFMFERFDQQKPTAIAQARVSPIRLTSHC